MPLFLDTCFSDRHEQPVQALPRRTVCIEHIDEEPRILEELARLEHVARDIQQYEDYKAERKRLNKREHADSAKALDRSLAAYFNRYLGPDAQAVEGYRDDTQLDIVVPRGSKDLHSSVTARVLHRASGDRVAAHFEIAYRSSPVTAVSKFREMLASLDETIRQARKRRTAFPLTGVTLLGPAWAPAIVPLLQELFDRYATRAERVRIGRAWYWTFPDLVVLPSLTLKKHDLFTRPSMKSDRVPCFMTFIGGGEPLRPFAVARWNLLHRVHILRGEARAESAPWTQFESGAITGRLPAYAAPTELPTLVPRARKGELWYLGRERQEATGRERPIYIPLRGSPAAVVFPTSRREHVRGSWKKRRS